MCLRVSALLYEAENVKKIKGIRIAQGAPIINYLFFEDDSLLFCHANKKEWLQVKNILGVYKRASDKMLSQQKTSIFYSLNTSRVAKQHIINMSGVSECRCQGKYLGLPAFIGKSKYSTFEVIKEKVWDRVNNWKNFYLSQAGKEILLKAVV